MGGGVSGVEVGGSVGEEVGEAVYVGSPGFWVGKGVGESVGDGVTVAVFVSAGIWAINVWSSATARTRLPPRITVEVKAVTNPRTSSRRRIIKNAFPRLGRNPRQRGAATS